jgi:FkbM family methyltransferase
MKESHGFWFPDYDNHFPRLLEKSLKKEGILRYQWKARDAAVALCEKRRVCLDIGANVGLWSCDLVESFERVVAFEPVQEFIECFRKNVKKSNYFVYACALGKEMSYINMNIVEGNTGHTHVDKNSYGKGKIPLNTLDSFNFNDIDMIKIDVEGLEEEILQGAEATIRRNKPVLVIEQQKHEYKDAMTDLPSVKILEAWGYEVKETFNKDWILKHRGTE